MKLELFIFAIVAFLLFNLYHDGKYTKSFMSYKKYYQMGIIVIVALSFYLMIRRNPGQTKNMLLYTNNYMKSVENVILLLYLGNVKGHLKIN